MGGDHAPHVVVEGALDALRQTANRFEVILVGNKDAIIAEMQKYPGTSKSIRIEHAPEVVNFDDDALAPIRTKKQSSITVGLQLQKAKEADAFVSAGHTGAVMSASTLLLGRIEGVGRPTIAATLPSGKGYCLLTDAGTNVDCRPQHLREFGIMASIFAEEILHYPKPRVGLLSIGEEKNKGDELTLEAYKLLEQSGVNFVGNIEGRDILKGNVQVAVCDGFVGNVVLKFAEGMIELLRVKLKMFAERSLWNKVRIALAYGTLKKVLKEFDYRDLVESPCSASTE